MPQSTPVRFQVRVPAPLKLRLQRAARARGHSLSTLLRVFLTQGVKHRKTRAAS